MRLIMRGMHQSESDASILHRHGEPATVFPELLRVTNYPAADPVLTWDDGAAAIDVDMPRGTRIPPDFLWRVSGFTLQPDYFWQTHSGGFRGIFLPASPLAADELAALFAYLFVARQGVAYERIELKQETRHPLYLRTRDGRRCGRVHRGHAGDATRVADSVIGDDESVSDEQVSEWLDSKNMVKGRRYPHDQCPIAPSSKGHDSPVVPLDRGVYCHYCKASGPRGFISYVELIDPARRRKQKNPLKCCARGMAHWGHARRVVESVTDETGKRAELLYRALLKLVHLKPTDDDKRSAAIGKLIDAVFFPACDIVRGKGRWFRGDLTTECAQPGLADILPTLPACRYVDEMGKVKKCSRTLGFLKMNGDLADYGYPSLRFVRGVDFEWRKWLDVTRQHPAAEPWLSVRCLIPADPPFIHRQVSQVDLAWAESHIERNFPGVRFDILRLLIAGKGISQLNPPEPPLVMIHGQSEAAKTAHVFLAAELCCDHVERILIGKDVDEFMRGVVTAANAGAFAFMDEIAKTRGVDKVLADRLLRVQRKQNYRELWLGYQNLPQLPAFVLADTVVPSCLQTEVQLARRVVEINLGCGIGVTGKNWRKTCGTGDILGWRAALDENTKAADIFMSDVMDNYADSDFLAIAERLGFNTFRDGNGDLDTAADLKAFFRAVCEAPDANSNRTKGRGYKLLDPERGDTPLEKTFRALVGAASDPLSPSALQAITGVQWGRALGVAGVELDFHKYGKRAFVRFRVGSNRAASTRINEEILAAQPCAVAHVEQPSVAINADLSQLSSGDGLASIHVPP